MNGTSEPHARHDRHLVAALAADDLEPVVRTEAETLVASCRDCAELFADLKVIAAATAALPDIPRTRDFRLTAADAARLQPRGWRGLLDAIGGARASFSRPLATGLTTLGLVGLLVTTIPGALSGVSFGSAGAAPAPIAAPVAGNGGAISGAPASVAPQFGPAGDPAATAAPAALASVAPSAAATADSQVKTDVPTPVASRESVQAVGTTGPVAGGAYGVPPPGTKGGGHGAGAGASEGTDTTNDQSAGRDVLGTPAGSGGPSPLLPISIVCLLAGLALFAARWGARRLARR